MSVGSRCDAPDGGASRRATARRVSQVTEKIRVGGQPRGWVSTSPLECWRSARRRIVVGMPVICCSGWVDRGGQTFKGDA